MITKYIGTLPSTQIVVPASCSEVLAELSLATRTRTMSVSHRIAVLVILAAVAVLSSFISDWPMRGFSLLGRSFLLSGNTLLGCIACALALTGTDGLLRSHPQAGQVRLLFLRCISPAAVTAAAWILLARLSSFAERATGSAALAGGLALLIAAEYYAIDPAAPRRAVAHMVMYLVAALLYAVGHLAALDVNAARVAVVVSALVALRLLGEEPLPLSRILWASLGLGFSLGAVAWLLHSRVASPIQYSLTLVVLLYVLTGLVRQFLWGKLQREVILEYVLVGLGALAMVFFFAR